MVSRIEVKGGYSHRQRGRKSVTQVREEEIEIGERMTMVSDRMRKEVEVLFAKLDSRKWMSAEEMRDVVKTGLKVVVEAVEKTMTSISDTLTNERKERKEEEKEENGGKNRGKGKQGSGQGKKGGGQTADGDVGDGGQNKECGREGSEVGEGNGG